MIDINLFQEFQQYLNEKKIEMTNKEFDNIVYNYTYYLISKDNCNEIDIEKINQHIDGIKIATIDKIGKSNDQYFILSFQSTILIIHELKLSIIQSFFTNNKDLTLYFYHNSKESFDKCINYDNAFSIDSFKNEIHNFREKFQIRRISRTKLISFWNIIQFSFSAFLVIKSYQNFCQNRIKEIRIEIDKKEQENVKFTENEFIHLNDISSPSIGLYYHIAKEKLFIIKRPDKYLFDADKYINRELRNYLNISHPFVPQFYGTITNNDDLFLVIEYIHGKALNKIIKNDLNDQEKLRIIFELMITIEYLHNKCFVYRDLKPDNVILDNNGTAVLIDFDKMILFDSSQQQNLEEVTRDCSPLFSAPEISQGKVYYTSDVYSLGLMIYSIFTGKYPRENYLEENHFDDFPQKFSKLKILFNRCINENPEKRPSISELIDTFYIDYFSSIHIHGLNINENESYLQQLSEINTIKTNKDIHSKKYAEYWTFIAEYDKEYSKKNLSLIYSENKLVPADFIKFYHYHSLIENKQIQVIQYDLGDIHLEGKKVKQDVNKAIYFYKLSADKNYDKALFALGKIYSTGKYIEKDIQKAIYYYSQIPKNYIEAQLNLGFIYYNDEYNIHDYKKAIECFTVAADAGYSEAQFSLGEIFESNKSNYFDINMAIYYYSLASIQNHQKAQFNLGALYMRNNYTSRSLYYFELAANNGNPKAQCLLGELYLRDKNMDKAIHYFNLAADQNEIEAQFILGHFYLNGNHVTKDIDKAIHYLKPASDNGHPKAQSLLGIIYSDEQYNKYDIKKAIYYYELAVKQLDKVAANNLGAIYFSGDIYAGIESNLDKACYCFTIAANKNEIGAIYNLGLIYNNKKFSKYNVDIAIKYLTIAANQNFQEADYQLGFIYYQKNDVKNALKYLLQAANKYNSNALFILGNIYERGSLVTRDIEKAIYYYKRASDLNNCYAQNNLGLIYYNGFYVPRDVNKAIHYFLLSSNLNFSEGQYNLGNIYIEGKYIQKDVNKAFHYMSLSAAQNNSNAAYFLGLAYLNGEYVERDIDKSIYYYKIASFQGNEKAQNNLACIYYKYKKDYANAIDYLKIAASNNNSNSQFSLAVFHFVGDHVELNIEKAMHYLISSAENYNNNARFLLAFIYHIGKYVEKDHNKAVFYYKQLSSLNDLYAKNNLAVIYKNKKEIPRAIEYLNEAIKNNNDVLSMINLAKIYFYDDDDDDNNINKSIDLLIKSSKEESFYSPHCLCMVLMKKFGFMLDYKKIQEEIKRYTIDSKDLLRKVCMILNNYQLNDISFYSIMYIFYQKYDFIYNWKHEIYPICFEDKIDNSKFQVKNVAENINEYFYEGFCI